MIAGNKYGSVWPTREIAEVAAAAARHVLKQNSLEVARVAAWNSVCQYVAAKKEELEEDDTLDVVPAAASSNGTLLAVPPVPSTKDKEIFSSLNQKRLTEYNGHGIYPDFETGKLCCSCNGQPIPLKTSNFKNHFNGKRHKEYEEKLDVTELKRQYTEYLQQQESYDKINCLAGLTICQDCYQIVSEGIDNGGKKRHESKFLYQCSNLLRSTHLHILFSSSLRELYTDDSNRIQLTTEEANRTGCRCCMFRCCWYEI